MDSQNSRIVSLVQPFSQLLGAFPSGGGGGSGGGGSATSCTGDFTIYTGSLLITDPANTVKLRYSGTNGCMGRTTLAGGVGSVATTAVTAYSNIFLTAQDDNTPNPLRISARTPGSSFDISSTDGTGSVAWMIIEPLPQFLPGSPVLSVVSSTTG